MVIKVFFSKNPPRKIAFLTGLTTIKTNFPLLCLIMLLRYSKNKKEIAMILRYRQKPIPLKKYKILIPRLRPDFPGIRKIHTDQEKRIKEYIGEKSTDYHTSHHT